MRALKSFLGGRAFRQGSLSALLSILFIAVVVALNVAVSALSERYNLRLDLSLGQAFVLSDQSEEFLKGLTEEVSIHVLVPEQNLAASGDYFLQANEVIKQYERLSEYVTVSYVDLTRDLGFARNYPEYQLDSSTVLLESGGRTATLSVYDLFNIESDSSSGGYYVASSQAEQAMTGAMMSLTMPHPPTISFLSGFGEGGAGELSALLSQNRYTIAEDNLLTGDINPDATLVVISEPVRDYSPEALEKLDAYLYNGGAYGRHLLYFAGLSQPATPNLNDFLADWGILVEEGGVYQTDPSYLVVDSAYWSVAEYADEVFSEHVAASQLYTVVPEARPLTLLDSGGEKSVLLEFGEGACVDDLSEGFTPEASTRWGPIPAMILSKKTGYAEDEFSCVAVCGSARMMDAYLMQSPYVGNAEYLLNLAGELLAREEITIAPKTIGGSYLMLSELQTALIGAIFAVMLPIAVLVAGGVVFIRRRHL
ncbi:MAG: GldG family protein [Oscillospiraceae bacterium]|nr:GldG family protein [Oscillospiraceae bacterium]